MHSCAPCQFRHLLFLGQGGPCSKAMQEGPDCDCGRFSRPDIGASSALHRPGLLLCDSHHYEILSKIAKLKLKTFDNLRFRIQPSVFPTGTKGASRTTFDDGVGPSANCVPRSRAFQSHHLRQNQGEWKETACSFSARGPLQQRCQRSALPGGATFCRLGTTRIDHAKMPSAEPNEFLKSDLMIIKTSASKRDYLTGSETASAALRPAFVINSNGAIRLRPSDPPCMLLGLLPPNKERYVLDTNKAFAERNWAGLNVGPPKRVVNGRPKHAMAARGEGERKLKGIETRKEALVYPSTSNQMRDQA